MRGYLVNQIATVVRRSMFLQIEVPPDVERVVQEEMTIVVVEEFFS